jgi:hypothetical protein
MKQYFIKFSLAFAIGGMLISCGGSESDAPVQEQTEEKVEETMEEDFVLPSAFQLVSLMENSGMKYNEKLTNPIEKAPNYVTKTNQLLNLGVYSANLSYTLLSDQFDPARKYFKVVIELADKTGLSEIYNPQLYAGRFEKNIGKKDSLIEMINELQEKVDLYIFEFNQPDIAVISFVGSWIEANYIASNSINNENKNILHSRLLEQFDMAAMLASGLKQVKSPDGDIAALIEDLNLISSLYENLPVITSKSPRQSFQELKVSSEELQPIFDVLAKSRKRITQS